MKKILLMLFVLLNVVNVCNGKQEKVDKDDLAFQEASELSKAGQKERAFEMYLELARKDYTDSKLIVGSLYLEGIGVEKNFKKAEHWLLEYANERRDPEIYFILGELFYDFDEPERDYKKAAMYFKESAELGYIEAQTRLSEMYTKGEGVLQDYTQSRYWLEKAAQNGGANAMVLLGNIYRNGQGVKKDVKRSFDYYLSAAKKGNLLGQLMVSILYSTGEGVLQSDIKAYMWANLAHYNGYKDGEKLKREIKASMTMEAVIRAQELSQKCLDSDYKDCG